METIYEGTYDAVSYDNLFIYIKLCKINSINSPMCLCRKELGTLDHVIFEFLKNKIATWKILQNLVKDGLCISPNTVTPLNTNKEGSTRYCWDSWKVLILKYEYERKKKREGKERKKERVEGKERNKEGKRRCNVLT